MGMPRESSRSFGAACALFAAIFTVASAGWLAMSASKAAPPEKAKVAANKVERGLTLKEWLLIAK